MQREAEQPAVPVVVDLGAQVREDRRSRRGEAVEDLDQPALLRDEDASIRREADGRRAASVPRRRSSPGTPGAASRHPPCPPGAEASRTAAAKRVRRNLIRSRGSSSVSTRAVQSTDHEPPPPRLSEILTVSSETDGGILLPRPRSRRPAPAGGSRQAGKGLRQLAAGGRQALGQAVSLPDFHRLAQGRGAAGEVSSAARRAPAPTGAARASPMLCRGHAAGDLPFRRAPVQGLEKEVDGLLGARDPSVRDSRSPSRGCGGPGPSIRPPRASRSA